MAFSYPLCGRSQTQTQTRTRTQTRTVNCHLQKQASPGEYGKPPSVFKGRALYQLHLVKTEIARAIVPKDFKLLEAFGYTLGGFFLASYEESPFGSFDELVVIAGTGNVPNNLTSCSWAASAFVNSEDACVHGRQEFGLPSQVASFSKSINPTKTTKKSKINRLLSSISIGNGRNSGMDIEVTEIDGPDSIAISCIGLTSTESDSNKWMCPLIEMSLPSFSGLTEYNPHLLKYSCQIQCRVRPVSPAKVWRPSILHSSDAEGKRDTGTEGKTRRDITMLVMLSKPILALEFNCLKMVVEPPLIVSDGSDNTAEYSL